MYFTLWYSLNFFIKNYQPQSKGNAFEILFVTNLRRVGTNFRLRFCDIFRPVSLQKLIIIIVTLRNIFYLYLSRILGLRVKEMPLKQFLSSTCAESGRLFVYDFVTFLGQFLQNSINNYLCYSAEQILFIFIENYLPQSKGNAFGLLFIKNLCRVGATFLLRFTTLFRSVSVKQQ